MSKSKYSSAIVRVALVSVAFTLVMLWWSFDRFRLQNAPFPDDVTWLNEGIALLDSLRMGGVPAVIRHLSEAGPLLPYSVVAAVGFAVFGIKDWAPYLMNGWLVFSLLFFLEVFRRREQLPVRAWWVAAAVALAFPCCGYTIISFVGDHPTGMFSALGVVAFIRGWPASKSSFESWMGTLAWVFAFFGKATLFPETAFIFFLSAALGCALSIWEAREIAGARRVLMVRWIFRTLTVPVLALPYYGLIARPLFNYLYLNNFGAQRQVWAFQGTHVESLLYYLTGFSGGAMLSAGLYLAIALLIAAIALCRNRLKRAPTFAALLMIALVTYAMPTSLDNKTPFVGAPFQFLVVLTAVMSYWSLRERFSQRAGVVDLLVCVAVLFAFRFPDPLDRRNTPAVVERNRTMNDLLAALEKQNLKPGEPVFLTTIGYVGVSTLNYEFRKRRLPGPRFFDLALSNDVPQFPPAIDRSAFVIATEPGNDEIFYTTPSAFLQDKTLAMVRENPAFIEIARFSTWRGKYTYLYGRRGRAIEVPSTPQIQVPEPCPVLEKGNANICPGEDRWTERKFEIEFPAPRGLEAELKLRFAIPQETVNQHGPVTIEVNIPVEGGHRETFREAGVHEFVYRYIIRKHLVSTVSARFHLNEALRQPDGSERGILLQSAELKPIEANQ